MSKKILITLKEINVFDINEKYGFSSFVSSEQIKNKTLISDLQQNDEKNVISFLDDMKTIKRCVITMIDYHTKKNVEKININCFWDRNPIPTNIHPIGCPIRYVPNQLVKKYKSNITKDNYVIKENITSEVVDKTDDRLSIVNRDYYLVDGYFCSFNCLVAFIEDNKHNNLYKNSYYLTLKMYKQIFEKEIDIIKPAYSWKILKEYGGIKSIKDFRENLNKVDYIYQGTFFHEKLIPISSLFEEKLKF